MWQSWGQFWCSSYFKNIGTFWKSKWFSISVLASDAPIFLHRRTKESTFWSDFDARTRNSFSSEIMLQKWPFIDESYAIQSITLARNNFLGPLSFPVRVIDCINRLDFLTKRYFTTLFNFVSNFRNGPTVVY